MLLARRQDAGEPIVICRRVVLEGGPECGALVALSRAESAYEVEVMLPPDQAKPGAPLEFRTYLYVYSGCFTREGIDIFRCQGVRSRIDR